MLGVKKRHILIVISTILLLVPTVSASYFDTFLQMYMEFAGFVDFAIIFGILTMLLAPHTSRLLDNSPDATTPTGIGIAGIIGGVSSLSLIKLFSSSGIQLIDIWYIPALLVGAGIIGIIKNSLGGGEGDSALSKFWGLIPVGLVALIYAIMEILPGFKNIFPFYILNDAKGIVIILAIILLLIWLFTRKKGEGKTKDDDDDDDDDDNEKIKKQKEEKEKARRFRVSIRVPKGGKKIGPGQSTKLDAIVQGYAHDDENLQYFWAADFPINNPDQSSVIIPWEAVEPERKTVTKRINVTVLNRSTGKRKSASTKITFLFSRTGKTKRARLKITKPKSKKPVNIVEGKKRGYACKLVGLNTAKYHKKNIEYHWYIRPGFAAFTTGSIGGDVFGVERSFSTILSQGPGEYTIGAVALHSGEVVAVDSQKIRIVPKKAKGPKEWWIKYHGIKRLKIKMTGNPATDKKIKALYKKMKRDGSLDALLKAHPGEREIDLTGAV